MKQIGRRIILVVLCLCMAIGLVPQKTSASTVQSRVSTRLDTFEQFRADYYLSYSSLGYFLDNDELPYHTYVNNDVEDFEETLATWRIANMGASDLASYSQKEVDFYILMIYDIIYQKTHENSALHNFNTYADSLMLSSLNELTQKTAEGLTELTPDLNIMEDNWEETLNIIVNTETFSDLTEYTGPILKSVNFAGNVADLYDKLAMMKEFINCSDEINLILKDLRNNTSDELLKEAIRQVQLMATGLLTEEEIIMIFGGDLVKSKVSGFVLDKLWDAVKSSTPAFAGASIGQKIGQLVSNYLVGTDAIVATWYSMEKVYTFEKALKECLEGYISSFQKNPTFDNAVKLNRAADMYLNTLSVGMEYAIDYAEAVKGGGIVGWFYKNLHKDKYEAVINSLKSIKCSIDFTVEYANNETFNFYLDEMEYYNVHNVEVEQTPCEVTKAEVEESVEEADDWLFALVNQTVDSDTTSTEEQTTYANYHLKEGTLDLNGQALTVYGDFHISGGKMNVHGGSLVVLGDFYQTGGTVYLNGGTINVAGNATMAHKTTDGNYKNLAVGADLTMDNEADVFTVGGNLITAYYNSSKSKCSAGTMKIGANWTNYVGSSSGTNFKGSDSFTVVMTGTQNVTIDSQGYIDIPVLKIENASNRNITIQGTIYTGSLTGGNVKITADETPVLRFDKSDVNVEINGNVILDDTNLNGHELNVRGDLTIQGDLTLGNPSTNAFGKVAVEGDLLQTDGNIKLNYGSLTISGNATMAKLTSDGNYKNLGSSANLTMNNEADAFTVGGNLITAYYNSNRPNCSAGTLKIGANWTNYVGNGSGTNFKGSDSFTVVMTGTQNVAIDGQGYIDIPVLKIENAPNRNITMQGTVYTGSLTGGNAAVTAIKTPTLHFGKTDGTLTIHGDVRLGMETRAGGNVEIHGSTTLDDTILYGHEMNIDGDLTIQGDVTIGNAGAVVFGKITAAGNLWQTDGNIKLNYGSLTVSGSATMAKLTSDGNYKYLGSGANLTMDNESDVFTVGGNLITAYYNSNRPNCSAGTLKIGANWTNYVGNGSGTNFKGSDSFTVVMTGTQNVAIDGQGYIDIPVLKIENAPNRNITMQGTVYTESLIGGNEFVTAVKAPTLHFGKIDGNLKISGDLTLGLTLKNNNTVSVYGNVFMGSYEDITLSSGSTLNIEGNLIQSNGTVQPAGGSLKIYGDYRIQSGSDSNGWSNSYGELKMTNAQDFVLVGGDFYTQSSDSHSSYLTAGEMVIYGDFCQLASNSSNFKASGTHKVYLCGDTQQSVKFHSADSIFNTLQLRYNKDGYIFDPDPCWKTLIEGQGLPENYKLTYAVTYNANGGEGQPDPQEKIQKIDLVLSDMVPTREAHKFIGWATEAAATTAEYLPRSTYSEDKSVVLYAVWEPIRYTVSYDANGGQGAPEEQTGAYGTEISVSSTVPTPAKEYTVTLYRNDGTEDSVELPVADTFASWNTAVDGTGTSYTAGETISLQEDITLYAQWKEAVLGDYEYELRPGYYLYGWFDSLEVDADGNPTGRRYLPETEITEDIALYGIWKETDTTTLYYGDINRDGIADFPDICLLNKYRLDKGTPDYDMEEYLLRADADRDRDADIDDIEILNQLRLNKMSQSDLAVAHTGTTVVVPEKVNYTYGEPLDTTGLGLTIAFNGNTSYTITDDLKVSGYDPEQAGTQTLTVTFYQFAATYSVVVSQGTGEPDETINVTINSVGSANSGAVVNAPTGGWTTGNNIFTVTCEFPCVVAVSYDGGNTYTRLSATATSVEKTYSFTVENVTADTIISVVLRGDVNADGMISNADITRLAAAYSSKITLTSLDQLAADVNTTDDITNADITKLSAAYAQKTALDW